MSVKLNTLMHINSFKSENLLGQRTILKLLPLVTINKLPDCIDINYEVMINLNQFHIETESIKDQQV